MEGFVPASFVAGQVFIGHLAVEVLFEEAVHCFCGLAFVKGVACGLDAIGAAPTFRKRLLLCIDHVANEFPKVLVDHEASELLTARAVLEPILLVVRPTTNGILPMVDGELLTVVEVVAVLSKTQSVLDHAFEAHGSKTIEGCQPNIHVSRNDAGAVRILVVREVVLQGCRRGCRACTSTGEDFVLLGAVQDQRRHTGPAGEIERRDLDGHGSSNACIERVSPILENENTGQSGKVIARRHHGAGPEDIGAHGFHIVVVVDRDVAIEGCDELVRSALLLFLAEACRCNKKSEDKYDLVIEH